MRRAVLLSVALGLASATLSAQERSVRPTVLLSGGVAGQYDGDRDLGSPGLSAAFGLEWALLRAMGLRVELQGVNYGKQAASATLGLSTRRGSAERLGAVSAAVTWGAGAERAVRGLAPGFYVLGGGALVQASVSGEETLARAGAAVLGAGLRSQRWAGVELQYVHAAQSLGATRSALVGRLQLSF